MNYFIERAVSEISEAISDLLGIAPDLVEVEEPNKKFDADLAVPCFRLGSSLSRSPQDIASELAERLNVGFITRQEAAGGFLNIWIKPEAFARGLIEDNEIVQGYGTRQTGKGKTVIVDYIGLNLSKPFSVGHLRPTLQGQALINLYRALGYEVIGDSHIGDWGTPFGMWVVGFNKWGNEEQLENEGAYELGRLYVKFRHEAEKNPELIDEAKEWLKKLEAGDAEAADFQKRFSSISLDHMDEILGRLGVKADENLGESFYIMKAKELVRQLVDEGVAIQQDDGSVIVSLDEYGIETPILVQKSDGSLLYATTDIETIRYREERWHPEKIIYSVGGEQQFHFKQVFALAEKLGYSADLVHPWFGTIDEKDESGKRTKMSSRKMTALLKNLLDKADEVARQTIKAEAELSDEDISKISIGAIKFTDFSQARRTNILFDWERMFSLHGFSGPYVQYAAVRVNSILSKINQESDGGKSRINGNYDWVSEKELLGQLAKYPLVVHEAAEDCEPHRVAQYVYDLARNWNKYYEEVSVKDSEGPAKEARLFLLSVLADNFSHALGLLGINIPSKM